jgi:8-oxo-dGTP pyrophosphatase MutT (NUDIX family)
VTEGDGSSGNPRRVPGPRRAFSVAVYARRGDRVLVIEHRRLATWLPIGGELDPGETPLEAAQRELREETGLVGRFRLGWPGRRRRHPGCSATRSTRRGPRDST